MTADKINTLIAHLPTDLKARIKTRQSELEQLRLVWQQEVGQELSMVTDPKGYDDGILTIRVASPVWASRLRHQSVNLMCRLRKNTVFRRLKKLKLQVSPITPAAAKRVQGGRRPRLSGDAQKIIRSAAQYTSDPSLRAALNRLADPKPEEESAEQK